jgi:hypothetical protein
VCSWLCEGLAVSKASERLRNGADVGRTKSAIKPARMRSDVHKFGDRCRERVTIKSWCLRIRDSATMERTPPGRSRRNRVARKWMKRTTKWRIEEW